MLQPLFGTTHRHTIQILVIDHGCGSWSRLAGPLGKPDSTPRKTGSNRQGKPDPTVEENHTRPDHLNRVFRIKLYPDPNFSKSGSGNTHRHTECPKSYRKSVLHLLRYTKNLYLSRCSTHLR